MKVSNKFGLFLIIASAIIMFLNFYKMNGKKKFLFNRVFKNNIIIKNDGEVINNIGNNHIVNSKNNFIVEDSSSIINDTLTFHRLYYHNIVDSNHSFKTEVSLPTSSRIAFCNETGMLCIEKLKLSLYEIQLKTHKSLPIPDFIAINIFTLNNNLSKILCLGEQKMGDNFLTGFYVLNLDSNKIELQSKIIETNKSSKAIQNILIYDCNFSSNDEQTISYYCDKFSKIFCFDYHGVLKNKITTKDNTPLPTLVENVNGYFYKRGYTFLTNNGVIIKNDKALVFSSRTENNKTLMIDFYSLKSNAYLYSHEFSYKNKSCADINFIRSYNNKVYTSVLTT